MNKQLKIWSLALSMLVVVAMNSCKDDPALPDNLATFEAATVGFEGSSKDVKVILSRAESADVSLTISLTPTGVVYGTQFTTTPAATSNALTLVIPAGSTEASFKVTKPDGVFLEGTESINFTITGATNPIVLGETLSVKLSFSAIVSDGSQLTLQGIAAAEAGTSAANAVFVNFKSNTQTSVLRSSWDLGFYSGTDFRVVLNNTRSAGAKITTATNLADVAAADTVGLTLAVSQSAPAPAHYAFFDGLDGSLSSTVIPAISSTADDNKVIIINRGTGGGVAARPWIKAKITRNANGGYTIQYGTIKQTSGFTSVDIPKDAAYNFKFLSFNSGTTVDVEPKKTDWDFYWSYSLYQTTFGGNLVPYNFSDMVAINTQGGVKVAEVLTSTVSYDNYSESNIASSTFASGRFAIGSGWRTATSDASPHVLADRFYVIQGASGNVYKLKFISFHPSESGTRGKPVITYKLVKKAS